MLLYCWKMFSVITYRRKSELFGQSSLSSSTFSLKPNLHSDQSSLLKFHCPCSLTLSRLFSLQLPPLCFTLLPSLQIRILPLPQSAEGIYSSFWIFLSPIALDIAQDFKNRNLYICLFCCMSFIPLSHIISILKVETNCLIFDVVDSQIFIRLKCISLSNNPIIWKSIISMYSTYEFKSSSLLILIKISKNFQMTIQYDHSFVHT